MTTVQGRSVPEKKVVFRAYWTEMVALNFQIDPGILEPLVPPGLELDFHADASYISLVCATCRDVRIWGLPLPITRSFRNVYLRFYVLRKFNGEVMKGSCLVKSLVSSGLARWSMSRTIKTPVSSARITADNSGFDGSKGPDSVPIADYHWKIGGEENRLRVKARHRINNLSPETKVGFVLARSHHFVNENGVTLDFPMQITSSNVWDAAQASFRCDAKHVFGSEFSHALGRRPVSVFLAEKNTTYFYKPSIVQR